MSLSAMRVLVVTNGSVPGFSWGRDLPLPLLSRPFTIIKRNLGIKMADVINIIIINRLVKEKRYLNIYHHGTGSSHLISALKEVAVPLNFKAKNDYLTISVVGEPGHMWHGCKVSLPFWLDFDFLTTDAVTLSHSGGGERIIIHVPPGLPNWQLKITRQKDSRPRDMTELKEDSRHRIIISDAGEL